VKDLGENEDDVGAPSRIKERNPDRSFQMKDGKGKVTEFGARNFLVWDPQGRRIATVVLKRGARAGFIPVINIYGREGALLHEFVIKNELFNLANARREFSLECLAWSPDGFKIAAGLGDGTIRVFKTPK